MKACRVLGALAGSLLLTLIAWPVEASTERDHYDCFTQNGGDLDRIIEACTVVLKDPRQRRNRAPAYYNRGIAHRFKGEWDAALADLGSAIEADPEFARAYQLRGIYRWQEGELDLALADLTEAIRNEADFATISYGFRALVYAEMGDIARALADQDEQVRIFADFAFSYRDRGVVLLYSGAPAKAVADFSKAAELEPANPYSAIWLELAQRRQGQSGHLREAAGRFDKSVWPAPVVRLLLGEMTIEAVMAAAAEEPEELPGRMCDANLFVAEFLMLQGKQAAATEHYRQAQLACPRQNSKGYAARAGLAAIGGES